MAVRFSHGTVTLVGGGSLYEPVCGQLEPERSLAPEGSVCPLESFFLRQSRLVPRGNTVGSPLRLSRASRATIACTSKTKVPSSESAAPAPHAVFSDSTRREVFKKTRPEAPTTTDARQHRFFLPLGGRGIPRTWALERAPRDVQGMVFVRYRAVAPARGHEKTWRRASNRWLDHGRWGLHRIPTRHELYHLYPTRHACTK